VNRPGIVRVTPWRAQGLAGHCHGNPVWLADLIPERLSA
jgi:hypothetical protein